MRRMAVEATAKKCIRSLEIDAASRNLEIRLMNQSRSGQCLPRALVLQMTGSEPSKLIVNEHNKLVRRAFVSCMPEMQKPGNRRIGILHEN
jgi:hypothetical protein